MVTCRKKHKQKFSKTEFRLYREYKRKGKSLRKKTRKNARKLLLIIEESEELHRPRQPITLKELHRLMPYC